jgi:hypothetical protein
MSQAQRATRNELQDAADNIRNYVDTHEAEPYSTNSGDFLVCYAKLEVPRVISERDAKFLRLFKGLSGDILAGAIYNEFGFKAWPDSEDLPEMPVRSLTFKSDLQSSTHVFNGTWDANDYPIISSVAAELVEDVTTAAPYETTLRPTHTN